MNRPGGVRAIFFAVLGGGSRDVGRGYFGQKNDVDFLCF